MTAEPLTDPRTDLRRKAVATSCVCCGLPLADSVSAAMGIGPNCAKRAGLTRTLKGNEKANDLLARAALAAENGDGVAVLDLLRQLSALDTGYSALIGKVRRRLFRVRVEPDGIGGYNVASTWNPETVDAFRGAGLWWKPVQRAWNAATSEQVDDALRALAGVDADRDALMPDGSIISLRSLL